MTESTEARFPFWWVLLGLYAVWIASSALQLITGITLGQTAGQIVVEAVAQPPFFTFMMWQGWRLHP